MYYTKPKLAQNCKQFLPSRLDNPAVMKHKEIFFTVVYEEL